jgi:hypothetical protein
MGPFAPSSCSRTGEYSSAVCSPLSTAAISIISPGSTATARTDTNFNVGVGCNNNVQALALDSQLRILVGGSFTQASGVTRNGLTRLNPDGTVDPSINFGFGANGFVDTIVIQTNDEIDMAGNSPLSATSPENNFARLYGGANAGNGSMQFSQQVYGVLENATNAII